MSKNTESQLQENRIFKPSPEFSKKARIKSLAQYRKMWDALPKPSKELNKEIDAEQTKALRGMLNDVRKMQKKQR